MRALLAAALLCAAPLAAGCASSHCPAVATPLAYHGCANRTATVYVVATAPWCSQCHAALVALARLAGEHAGDSADEQEPHLVASTVALAELDLAAHPLAASQRGVEAVPTVLVYRDGREIGRHVGVPDAEWLRGFVRRPMVRVEEPLPSAAGWEWRDATGTTYDGTPGGRGWEAQ